MNVDAPRAGLACSRYSLCLAADPSRTPSIPHFHLSPTSCAKTISHAVWRRFSPSALCGLRNHTTNPTNEHQSTHDNTKLHASASARCGRLRNGSCSPSAAYSTLSTSTLNPPPIRDPTGKTRLLPIEPHMVRSPTNAMQLYEPFSICHTRKLC